MNPESIGDVGTIAWRLPTGELHRHDGLPAHIELQGKRTVIRWAWAGEEIAQLVVTDYGELCLTVFGTRPETGQVFTGSAAVSETMAGFGLFLP